MKILYLVDYYQPDIGYNEYYLPEEWSKAGHEVKIMTSNFYYPFPNYKDTAGKLLGAREHQSGSYYQGKIEVIKQPLKFEIFTRAIFFGHETIINSYRPDLVIVNKSSSFNSFVAAKLKNKYGYKLLTYDAHLMSGYKAVGNVKLKNLIYWLYRVIVSGYMNRKVDKYIAVQEGTVDVMKNLYGQKPVEHIPLGTDPERFRFSADAKKKIRKKLKIPANHTVVIYTGKIIPTKGVDILFSAFNEIARKAPKLHLLLVGTGTEQYTASCLAKVEADFHNRIHFAGIKPNKELYKYYSAADFGVWPLEESTSMNDAASCGLPFIANDSAGVKFRFKNNNGLMYRRADAQDLSVKMLHLYQNPKVRVAMGKRGRQLIESDLSWSQIAAQYLNFLKEDDIEHLRDVLNWLKRAQDINNDGGVSAYYSLITGWAPSFIETTGYIIETFLRAGVILHDTDYSRRAAKMGDFLLAMQLPSGGFRTYSHDQMKTSEPTIFNTAQDLLGLLDLYEHTKNIKYLNSVMKAAEFLVREQNPDGTWTKFTHQNESKSFHSRVAWALLRSFQVSRKENYKKAAVKQLDWVLSQQLQNGWPKNAELPAPRYPFPITHTLAYVAEGLLYSGQILKNNKYNVASEKIVEHIAVYISRHHNLPSYFDQKWQPHEHFGCPSGEAQFCILLCKFYEMTKKIIYRDAAEFLKRQIKANQNRSNIGNMRGGVVGCTPIYGDLLRNRGYCRLCVINWAAKFTADAYMEFL